MSMTAGYRRRGRRDGDFEGTAVPRPHHAPPPPPPPPQQPQQELKIKFKLLRRGQQENDTPLERTIAFADVNGVPWRDVIYEDLWSFVNGQVALSFGLTTEQKELRLFTRVATDPRVAPLYLVDASIWRHALLAWRDESITWPTIFVETPAVSTSTVLRNIDLPQLQRGPSARRTKRETQIVLRELNTALHADPSLMANEACHSCLRLAELLFWRNFSADVVQIFGTADCHPHPGVWFCWCGMTTQIMPNHLGDLTAFNVHLSRCRFRGARVLRRRMFEFTKHGRVITTDLPTNMPQIVVPSRLLFDFKPNLLADGDLFVL